MAHRILIVAPHFAEYSERLAAGFAEQNPTHLILNSLNRHDEVTQPLTGGAGVTTMPMNRRPDQVRTFAYCLIRALVFRADIVIVQEGVRQFLKPLVRVLRLFTRVALIVHDPAPHTGSDSAQAAVHTPYRRWLRDHADLLIVHGENCRQAMVGLGYDDARIVTINHGVLMVPTHPGSIAAERGRALMFGRMESYKGLSVLLDAVEILNGHNIPLHLVVAGAGPEQDRFAERMAALGNVEVIPRYLSPEELEQEIGRASFVVAPYVDATQSGVLASTFANGRPAIATNVGGLGDVVKDGVNGLLVPPRDAPALADAMAQLLENPTRATVLADGAQAFADDALNWSRITMNLLMAFERLPARRRGATAGLAIVAVAAATLSPWPAASRAPGSFTAPDCSANATAKPGKQKQPPIADMYGTSEVRPQGARQPSGQWMSWALSPRIARGNNPQAGWTSMLPWGQVFAGGDGSQGENIRVQVRNLRLFVRPKSTGQWCLLQSIPTPIGAFYQENYADDAHEKGDQRTEGSAGVSFAPEDGHAFHFFPSRRVSIPVGGLTGVYSDFEARLVKDKADGPDRRRTAIFVASAGADYWKSDTAPPGHVLVLNEDAGIGRFRRIKPEWKTFSMNTAAPNARQRQM